MMNNERLSSGLRPARSAGTGWVVVAVILLAACVNPSGSSGGKPPEEPLLPPDTPAAFSILADDGILLVRWASDPLAESYKVMYSRLHDEPEQAESERTLDVSRVELTGLQNGHTYRIWVRAFNAAGASELSEMQTAVPAEPPAVPDWPAAEIVSMPGGFSLTWTAPEHALRYEVAWASGGPDPVRIRDRDRFSTWDLSCEITGLSNFTTCYVWVRAGNSKGFSEYGTASSCVPGVNEDGNATAPAGSPAVPVIESAAGELGVRLRSVSGATSYEVWYGKADDVSLAEKYGEIAFSGTVDTALQGLDEGSDYYVWVRALNAAGYSPWSGAASGRASVSGAPGAVSVPGLTAGNGTITVSWTALAGASSYDIYYRTAGQTLYRKAGTGSGSPYTITGIDNGTAYEVSVRARNASGPGPLSAAASITLPPSAPPPPKVKATPGRLTVSWQTVSGAEEYRVYWRERDAAGEPVLAGTYTSTEASLALPAGKIYRVWAVAVNAGGESPQGAGTERMLPSAFHQTLEALASWLGLQPAGSSPDAPHIAALENVDIRSGAGSKDTSDGLRLLYDSFQGRYTALDLDACTGATIGFAGYGNSSIFLGASRPDKDKLVSLVLPETATRVGWHNFHDCVNLRTVTFPPRLRSIGDYAFQGCASLEAADLPSDIRTIGAGGFSGCSSLRTLIVRASSPPTLGSGALSGCPADLSIRVPAASVAAYKANIGWNTYAAQISALAENE
jgi:hypothetical protein